tara:strand:+ start:553 stop:1503 length:951 start_codon:yes stop_codon:yes gene_type:complete
MKLAPYQVGERKEDIGMTGRTGCFAAGLVLLFAVPAALTPVTAGAQDAEAVRRGEYLAIAGGCTSCHTDFKNKGEPFAGGAPIPTPFGTFHPPNITPHPEHGIGGWSDADFIRAMREGKNPDGAHYFPAFPYTSYTKIAEADLRDMKAYLFSLPAIDRPSKPHDISFPFSWRFLQTGWKMLFFEEGAFQPDPARSAAANRGAYLSEALAHCGECHTPRNFLGGLDADRWMAGTGDGPEGALVPNITPDPETGLTWSEAEIAYYLKTGATPEFDFAGSLMADVISHNTGKLTAEDLRAIAEYLKSLKPVNHRVSRRK